MTVINQCSWCQDNTTIQQYQYEGRGCGADAAGRLSSPGEQVWPSLLQAVVRFGLALPKIWDQLAQQQPQQLQGGVENLRE